MVSLLACGLASSSSWALPLESANPGAQPPGGDLLRLPALRQFSVDHRLRKNVDFWVSIYGKYTTGQGLLHDAKYVDLVYEIVDLSHGSRLAQASKRKWRSVLLSVHRKQNQPELLNTDEKRVYEMFRAINEPNKFLNAAHRKRLRFQLGQKDRFLAGLKESGRYLPLMEEIFRKAGLPVELTRLPFVESSFNVRARSKVGASGIWQFMRSTGKLFLNINEAVDERNDPIRATEAAAKLLAVNYQSLRQWPLAVTAYNHGRKGMMRAIRLVGAEELEEVVSSYRSRSFGFASSNFFCELLAAIEVERNAESYFGKVERDSPDDNMEVTIPDYIDLRKLAQFLKLESKTIRELNPGLSELVFSGARLIPAGYRLRLPYDKALNKDAAARVFLAGYQEIPGIYKLRGQVYGKKHRVKNSS